jgi:hypothetical protein
MTPQLSRRRDPGRCRIDDGKTRFGHGGFSRIFSRKLFWRKILASRKVRLQRAPPGIAFETFV